LVRAAAGFLPAAQRDANERALGDTLALVSGRIKALFLLGLALLKTLILRFFRRGDGIARFRENYDADGLPPVTPEERANFVSFQRCVACGLCDRGEAGRIARSGGAYRGVMALVVSGSRSMPEFRAAAYGFGFVPDEVLAEKELICPVRIPFRRIARFVRDKAAAVGGPLPLPARVSSLPPKPRER
jgi:hypothetical protein